MSAGAASLTSTETPKRAEQVMAEKQVRRLPVTDASGRLIGVLSLSDLARATAEQAYRKRPALSARNLAVALGGICRPHASHAGELAAPPSRSGAGASRAQGARRAGTPPRSGTTASKRQRIGARAKARPKTAGGRAARQGASGS